MFIIFVFWLGSDRQSGPLFFVSALLLSILTPLFLPSLSISSSYFVIFIQEVYIYEGVIVPKALYGAEAWGMRSAERRKVNVLEMKCLRSLLLVSLVRNEEMHKRTGMERELASRADQRVLRWFGLVERMDEYRTARRVLMEEVSGGPVRGRPWLGSMDGVKVAFGNRGMTAEAARQYAKEWRALVHL